MDDLLRSTNIVIPMNEITLEPKMQTNEELTHLKRISDAKIERLSGMVDNLNNEIDHERGTNVILAKMIDQKQKADPTFADPISGFSGKERIYHYRGGPVGGATLVVRNVSDKVYVGVACCSEQDAFDRKEGVRLARERLIENVTAGNGAPIGMLPSTGFTGLRGDRYIPKTSPLLVSIVNVHTPELVHYVRTYFNRWNATNVASPASE